MIKKSAAGRVTRKPAGIPSPMNKLFDTMVVEDGAADPVLVDELNKTVVMVLLDCDALPEMVVLEGDTLPELLVVPLLLDRMLVTPLLERVLVPFMLERMLVPPLLERVLVPLMLERVLVPPLLERVEDVAPEIGPIA